MKKGNVEIEVKEKPEGDEKPGAPDPEGEEAKKSLTAEDLTKSLEKLEAIAKSGDAPSRKDELLKKASEGTLQKSEREELFGLLGGETKPTETLGDALTKGLKPDERSEEFQKALDVSGFLHEQHGELVKSLKAVGDEIQKSEQRRHEGFLVLAKAVCDIGRCVEQLHKSVEVIGGQPAHAPKSRGIRTQPSQVLNKGFAGDQPAEEQLSKSQVLDGLDALHEESLSKGMGGSTPEGEDILKAIAKYEQTNLISPTMAKRVQAKIQEKRAAAH